MPEHGLSKQQLQIIHDILAPYAEKIELVGLFGSRATGKARANSDIDIVLYGKIDETLINRVWTLFSESSLVLKVDIIAYNTITHAPLKEHIDAVMQPLFTPQNLTTSFQEA